MPYLSAEITTPSDERLFMYFSPEDYWPRRFLFLRGIWFRDGKNLPFPELLTLSDDFILPWRSNLTDRKFEMEIVISKLRAISMKPGGAFEVNLLVGLAILLIVGCVDVAATLGRLAYGLTLRLWRK